MMIFSQNTFPIPNCWRPAYEAHARANNLEQFPTQKFLKDHPHQSRRFCYWIWQQLGKNEGFMCEQPNTEACCACQRESVSKIISIRILSLLVKYQDPTLHFVLQRKFNQMKDAYPSSWLRHPHGDGPEPMPPVAVNMPVPKPWLFTNAVSKGVVERQASLSKRGSEREYRP